jgi:hypothetical protein
MKSTRRAAKPAPSSAIQWAGERASADPIRTRAPSGLCDYGARAPGRRRTGLLPGWRLSGNGRARAGAQLGRRHLDRIVKCSGDRRQSPGAACRTAARLLGVHLPSAMVARGARPDGGTHAGGSLPDAWRAAVDSLEATRAVLEGQNGFFVPRPWYSLHPSTEGPKTASFYDTRPLRATLERFADFERINRSAEMRVSVGAVNVRTGNFLYFRQHAAQF